MLDVRSANLMDMSALLPREAERIDMRYQWISPLPGTEHIDADVVILYCSEWGAPQPDLIRQMRAQTHSDLPAEPLHPSTLGSVWRK